MEVHVHSDRWYDVDADRQTVWAAFGATDQYRRWWPWLTEFEGGALARGEHWRCAVSPPLPYVVRFTVTLEDLEQERWIHALVDGDITGSAMLELIDGDDSGPCRIHLRSDLAPSHRVLRMVAGAAAPVVRRGHDWVLDTGARQFRQRAL